MQRLLLTRVRAESRRLTRVLPSPVPGFYIHTCPKMRYKADYQPSFLLDPVRVSPTLSNEPQRLTPRTHTRGQEANTYVPFAQCKPYLDTGARITSFSGPLPPSTAAPAPAAPTSAPVQPPPAPGSAASSEEEEEEESEGEDDDVAFPSPPPPGCLDPLSLPKDLLLSSLVLERRRLVPLLVRPLPLSPPSLSLHPRRVPRRRADDNVRRGLRAALGSLARPRRAARGARAAGRHGRRARGEGCALHGAVRRRVAEHGRLPYRSEFWSASRVALLAAPERDRDRGDER